MTSSNTIHKSPDNQIDFTEHPDKVWSIQYLKKNALIELCQCLNLECTGKRYDLITRLNLNNVFNFKWNGGPRVWN